MFPLLPDPDPYIHLGCCQFDRVTLCGRTPTPNLDPFDPADVKWVDADDHEEVTCIPCQVVDRINVCPVKGMCVLTDEYYPVSGYNNQSPV
jgi:hypothetical protein